MPGITNIERAARDERAVRNALLDGARTQAEVTETVADDVPAHRVGATVERLLAAGHVELTRNYRLRLTALGTMLTRRELIEAWQEDEAWQVNLARAQGVSWQAIADVTGLGSRQAAQQRFADLIDYA